MVSQALRPVPVACRLPNWCRKTACVRGELLWRIGMPVSALILALLAIPLSYVNPRAGRSANMLIAILIYAIYSNLMSVSQAWVAQGKLSFWVGVWAVHALMLLPLR
jgi:lipopolysaccharide export system permease protein